MAISCIHIEAFKQELKALLEKYDATIDANVGSGSDTHGIYDETMEISIRDNKKSFRCHNETVVNGWSISSRDLTTK